MAQYSPEMLAALRHAYEKTDQSMRLIADEFEIGITTLQTLVQRNGWAKRSQRLRGHPPPMPILAKTAALAAQTPSPDSARDKAPPSPALPLAGDGSADLAAAQTAANAKGDGAAGPPAAGAGAMPATAIVDLLEAEVRHELDVLQAARTLTAGQPRKRGETESLARTLANLTQAVQRIERMRRGQFNDFPLHESSDPDADDIPTDIDEFRHALARRIDAFVASRADAAGDDADRTAALVDEA